jgi:hypothetical protein
MTRNTRNTKKKPEQPGDPVPSTGREPDPLPPEPDPPDQQVDGGASGSRGLPLLGGGRVSGLNRDDPEQQEPSDAGIPAASGSRRQSTSEATEDDVARSIRPENKGKGRAVDDDDLTTRGDSPFEGRSDLENFNPLSRGDKAAWVSLLSDFQEIQNDLDESDERVAALETSAQVLGDGARNERRYRSLMKGRLEAHIVHLRALLGAPEEEDEAQQEPEEERVGQTVNNEPPASPQRLVAQPPRQRETIIPEPQQETSTSPRRLVAQPPRQRVAIIPEPQQEIIRSPRSIPLRASRPVEELNPRASVPLRGQSAEANRPGIIRTFRPFENDLEGAEAFYGNADTGSRRTFPVTNTPLSGPRRRHGGMAPQPSGEITTRTFASSTTRYQDTVLSKYLSMVWDRTGMPPEMVAEIKGLRVDPPEPYDGRDDLVVWERWLDGLLTYFYMYRVVGEQLDSQRVLLTGHRLTGVAATWFAQEVTGVSRSSTRWKFDELISALFRRFLTEITSQKAVDAYYNVKYSRAKGALGFWNDLVQAAERMIHPPDRGTMKRRFLKGLPNEILETTLKSRPINVELVTPDELIESIRQMEATLHYLQSRKRSENPTSHPTGGSSGNKSHSDKPKPQLRSRFVRLRPASARDWGRPSSDRPAFNKDSARRPADDRAKSSPATSVARSGPRPPRPPSTSAVKTTGSVLCFKCNKRGHYANVCPDNSSGAAGKAHTFAVQVEDQPGEESGEPSQKDQASAEEQDDAPDEEESLVGELVDGDQYDPDEVFVLEELEEVPDEDEDFVQVGSMRPEEDSVLLNSIRVLEPGELELEDEDNLVALRANAVRPKISPGDHPYRAHTSKERVGDRPVVPPKERACLAAYVTLNGLKAYALFDSGSTADLISPDFARVAQVRPFKLSQQIPIQLGCKGSRSAITWGCKVSGDLEDVRFKDVYFDVANIDRYDVILGNIFMFRQRIVLDVHEREIVVGGRTGKVIQAFTPEEETELLRKRLGIKPTRASKIE